MADRDPRKEAAVYLAIVRDLRSRMELLATEWNRTIGELRRLDGTLAELIEAGDPSSLAKAVQVVEPVIAGASLALPHLQNASLALLPAQGKPS